MSEQVDRAGGDGLTFDDDECYRLFICVDDCARAFRGTNQEVNALRERLLPFYRSRPAGRVGRLPESKP